jgi:hypothetical protein
VVPAHCRTWTLSRSQASMALTDTRILVHRLTDQPFLLDHATHHAQAQRTHTHNSQRTAYREKSEGKRGQSIQTIIFRSWSCCLSQTHLLSSKWRVQLHGGAANWWSCCSRVGLVELELSQTRPKLQTSSPSKLQIFKHSPSCPPQVK